jgi:hypothetical protein
MIDECIKSRADCGTAFIDRLLVDYTNLRVSMFMAQARPMRQKFCFSGNLSFCGVSEEWNEAQDDDRMRRTELGQIVRMKCFTAWTVLVTLADVHFVIRCRAARDRVVAKQEVSICCAGVCRGNAVIFVYILLK